MMAFFAMVLPVVILACGFAVDLGLLQMTKIKMQGAADAAAIGAELEVERGTGIAAAQTQGKLDAGLNGFTDGSNNTTVAIVQQPSNGPYAGDYDALQVTVSQSIKTIFMGALNGGRFTVSAQAVSLIPPCHFYTNTAGLNSDALWIASAGVYGTCPVYGNKAIVVDGFATLSDVATNVAGAPAASVIQGGTYPNPRYNAAVLADPLAAVTLPTFPNSCNYTSATYTTSTSLIPGVYCKGLTITGPAGGITINLAAGLYIITGGANWQNVTLTGSGVTIFFTKGNTAAQGNTFGQLSVRSSAINLSAPVDNTSGGIPRIVLCNDRAWVASSAQDFSFLYSSVSGDGIWYITGTGIYDFGANSQWGGTNYFAVVADNAYYYYSNVHPSFNFSNIVSGNPFRTTSVLVQ